MAPDKIDKVFFNDNMIVKPGSKTPNIPCLSNHYMTEMLIDGKQYNHVEGYYYSSKYSGINETISDRISKIKFPTFCKKIYNSNPLTDEQTEKWNTNRRVVVMKRALYIKFISNLDLAKTLMSTKDAKIVYNNINDNYWGIGESEKGYNILGKLLEDVRDTLNSLPYIGSENEDNDSDS